MIQCFQCGCRIPGARDNGKPKYCKFCRDLNPSMHEPKTSGKVSALSASLDNGKLKPSYIDGRRCN